MKSKWFSTVSYLLLWTLIMMGLLVQLVVIPEIAVMLVEQYSEYKTDGNFIQLILSSIVLAGQLTLALIWFLLRRVWSQEIIKESTPKWVVLLSASLFLSSATTAILLVWLINKNTLPPFLFLSLLAFILLSLSAALVTASLQRVLREAIATRLEMDAVI